MVDFKALLIALFPLIFVGIFLGIPLWIFWQFNNPWGLYVILGMVGIFLAFVFIIMTIGLYFSLSNHRNKSEVPKG